MPPVMPWRSAISAMTQTRCEKCLQLVLRRSTDIALDAVKGVCHLVLVQFLDCLQKANLRVFGSFSALVSFTHINLLPFGFFNFSSFVSAGQRGRQAPSSHSHGPSQRPTALLVREKKKQSDELQQRSGVKLLWQICSNPPPKHLSRSESPASLLLSSATSRRERGVAVGCWGVLCVR